MGTARQKITPKVSRAQDSSVNFRVPPPVMEVEFNPNVELSMPSPTINVDSRSFTEALTAVGTAVQQLAAQQTEILKAIKKQNESLTQLAGKKIPAPVVEVPSKEGATEFSVEFERQRGQTVGMRITKEG